MKTIQWVIAILVLALMVFLITIAMNFLGESPQPENGTTPTDSAQQQGGEPILTFPVTSFHGVAGPYYDQETKQGGYHDFLFGNETEEEVTVGVNSKSCKCLNVQLFLAPKEWQARAALSLHPGLFPASAWALEDEALNKVVAKLEPVMLFESTKDTKQEIKVAPHSVGWVRVRWNDRMGAVLFYADMWAKNKSHTAYTRLEANVRFSEPARFLESEIALGEIRLEELQNRQMPKQAVFKYWSCTRPALHTQATVVARPGKPGQAPILVGDPKRLNEKEVEKLHKEIVDRAGEKAPPPPPILCAYSLPVTLLDRSPDGKQPFPFGPFRTRIQVSFDEEGIEPITLMINGKLLGDVRIGGGADGRLSFGSFDATVRTQRQSVMLYSDVPGLELEIDKERTPPFLAKLAEIVPISTGDESSWKVSTSIPANSVSGQFPREDSEFFDCAVYVKTKGDASRSLRIPADGVAVVK